ncbi:amidase [Conexibacter sp. CPCC 206217]|uniref:amidase n=1 Tax=Conexibacter sp. CPCC 206217 TaxID=3064574 RepID=UPI00272005E1|nr:amidase [Conexibacter sp. CPCC 206217]MDO8212373.1 amidase [Conexibacter sp. CPCC 206217]
MRKAPAIKRTWGRATLVALLALLVGLGLAAQSASAHGKPKGHSAHDDHRGGWGHGGRDDHHHGHGDNHHRSPHRSPHSDFQVAEASIDDIQTALLRRKVTTTEIVEDYLDRIKAYNGTCVSQPDGVLGPITMIPNAGKVNALMTLNLRPAARRAWGFDDRKARSMTDATDNDPNMPDALETAAKLDAQFARTGKLLPLQGVVVAIKDQYDTFDMRTTSGADAFWANDRPPADSTVVARLRAAGAIVIAKANMDEYAGGDARSSFGGTGCNAYDTERDPGGSSGGSAVAVAANLVTCSIGEETGGSILKPARFASTVGMAPTRELVSAAGMIQKGLATRVGPICRSVADTAKMLSAYAGYDPRDEMTAFSTGRIASKPSYSTGGKARLDGYRIGVVREYMDKDAFTLADGDSIDLVDRAITNLRQLGATIVDPGVHGALFQRCVDRYVPKWMNQQFIPQFPETFAAGSDQISTLLDMYFDQSLVPHTATGRPSARNIPGTSTDVGDARYNFNAYIRERGDASIHSLTDLINKANFWVDPKFPNRKSSLERTDAALTLSTASAQQTRIAWQTVIYNCFADMRLDAVVYPSGNIPPGILTSPAEPTVNDRGLSWSNISSKGFPAMTVPAGFTTQVYDRGADGALLPPKREALPVGIEFLGLPFSEQTLFEIGGAYESATHRRKPPAEFPALD